MSAAAVATTCVAGLGAAAILLKLAGRPRAAETVPARMRRLVLVEANAQREDAKLEVQEVDTPKPRYNQVLIKVAAAPVNPSDDGVWMAPPAKGYPKALGNEGSGTVVATGGGVFANRLLGQNVAFAGDGEGLSWAEYAVVNALTGAVFTLPADVPVENGCAFFINPFTVVGIVETAVESGSRALIHTAAASQLGQMMVQYCKAEGVVVVNLVRREEQAAILRKLGAEHVLVTQGEAWQKELEALIARFKIKCAFDAVSGELSGTLLSLLPPGGTVYVYGRLAPEPTGNIQPIDLIYRRKRLLGFYLPTWLFKGGLLKGARRTLKTAGKVRKHLRTIFASEFVDTTLKSLHADYCKLLKTGRTGLKMRVRPHAKA